MSREGAEVSYQQLAAALSDRYRIERELGQGGMATVYLAEDLKHHRRVAVKVLHAELSALLGPERFLQEIELTASLQHPHILPLFDSGEVATSTTHDARPTTLLYYVMPFVDGETLRARLTREQQLPIGDAVRIASEMADALQYAHARGVIHRDIKPENILLQNGHALVADFGIALAVQQAGGQRMTQTGLSLGTPQYMSPEQAMGDRAVDARTDIYSLGAVTYEMLVGEPPFTGPNAQAIVAQVLTAAPPHASAHRRSVPAPVDAAVQTALEKLPADRFAAAAEFAAALGGSVATRRAQPAHDRRRQIVLGAAGLTVAALGAVAWSSLRRPTGSERTLHASFLPPPGCQFSPVATTNLVQLSADGGSLAFVATCGSDESIWIRSLATGNVRQLPGTSHGSYPFWSPDGASLGFFADGQLKRIDLETNAVRSLAPALNGRGGSWSSHDVILYAPDIYGPLYRIPAAGGQSQAATTVERGTPAHTHRLPYFLPDGEHFLFTNGSAPTIDGAVVASQLGSTRFDTLLPIPTNVAYANGRLLYTDDGLLMTRPFDPHAAAFTGPAASLVARLEIWPYRYLGNFTVATNRSLLVYRPAPEDHNRIEWFDPATAAAVTLLQPGRYLRALLSPDGHRILIEEREPESSARTLKLFDIASGTWIQIAPRSSVYYTYAWSPGGTEIVFGSPFDTVATVMSLDRTHTRTLPTQKVEDFVGWSPDSSYFLVQYQTAGTGFDIYTLSTSSLRKTPLLNTAADESGARLSPDGRMLAFISNESGAAELYVARTSAPGIRWRASDGGVALDPTAHRSSLAWSRDGRTIYFPDPAGSLMAVRIDESPSIRIGRPGPVAGAPAGIIDLSAAPDGRLLLVCSELTAEAPLEVVEHWAAMPGSEQ